MKNAVAGLTFYKWGVHVVKGENVAKVANVLSSALGLQILNFIEERKQRCIR